MVWLVGVVVRRHIDFLIIIHTSFGAPMAGCMFNHIIIIYDLPHKLVAAAMQFCDVSASLGDSFLFFILNYPIYLLSTLEVTHVITIPQAVYL